MIYVRKKFYDIGHWWAAGPNLTVRYTNKNCLKKVIKNNSIGLSLFCFFAFVKLANKIKKIKQLFSEIGTDMITLVFLAQT
jgi:hypothetical protein